MLTCEQAILEYFAQLHQQHGVINPSIAQICAAVQYKERRVQSAIHALLQQAVFNALLRCQQLGITEWQRQAALREHTAVR